MMEFFLYSCNFPIGGFSNEQMAVEFSKNSNHKSGLLCLLLTRLSDYSSNPDFWMIQNWVISEMLTCSTHKFHKMLLMVFRTILTFSQKAQIWLKSVEICWNFYAALVWQKNNFSFVYQSGQYLLIRILKMILYSLLLI